MRSIICCVSCGWGSKGNKKEVEQQTDKYGEFICSRCEESWNAIVDAREDSDGFLLDKVFGKTKALITSKHIYYHDGPRVKDPKTPFLGFGGSWFLVVDMKKPEIYVTNNLFHDRTVPEAFQKKLEKSGAINAKVMEVDKALLEELKRNLNDIPYLNDKQIKEEG